MRNIADLSCGDLLAHYRRRTLSPVEVVRDVLARIDKARPFNAFVQVDSDGALSSARESEQRWQRGMPVGRVDGVPATIKDNIWGRGLPTRKGSKTGDHAPATEDAPAVARLREQGAIFLGKTTMPEYGWIGACHSPLTGITRNPWNPQRTTGGSTGGGAVAALLNLGVLHLGTDGAGSLRIPAAFTGVFGMKPTYGLVPTFPASPFNVLAHQGPITRTVADAAETLSVISAPDARDMTAWNTPPEDFCTDLERGVRGLRIAWSPRLGYIGALDGEVEAACRKAAALLGEQGAIIEDADPKLERAGEIIRVLWFAGAKSIVDGVPERERDAMDPGFLQVAEWGRGISTTEYLAAYTARGDLHRAMLAFHERYDLLLTPMMPITAFEVGLVAPPGDTYGKDWLDWSPYSYPFNLTQQPAASVPCGLSSGHLPIGLQIVGRRGADSRVLQAARALERAQHSQPLNRFHEGKQRAVELTLSN
jgi:aspartyl-tRNA(Asn)/glutamyl-tRNA(Gln) amidotransferase subunit A